MFLFSELGTEASAPLLYLKSLQVRSCYFLFAVARILTPLVPWLCVSPNPSSEDHFKSLHASLVELTASHLFPLRYSAKSRDPCGQSSLPSECYFEIDLHCFDKMAIARSSGARASKSPAARTMADSNAPARGDKRTCFTGERFCSAKPWLRPPFEWVDTIVSDESPYFH
jgi:hypothetical protein